MPKQYNKFFFCTYGKKSLGRSPPQEPEVHLNLPTKLVFYTFLYIKPHPKYILTHKYKWPKYQLYIYSVSLLTVSSLWEASRTVCHEAPTMQILLIPIYSLILTPSKNTTFFNAFNGFNGFNEKWQVCHTTMASFQAPVKSFIHWPGLFFML